MTARLELTLRNWLRKAGLAAPILKLLNWRKSSAQGRLRSEYQQRRPTVVSLRNLPFEPRVTVRNVEEYVHYLSEPEVDIFRFAIGRLKPSDCVWDVGGNVGIYALAAAQAVGPQGLVCVFEPLKEGYDRLTANITLNGAANIRAVDVALGASAAKLFMQANPASVEGDHRVVDRPPEGAPVREVEVVRGDDFVQRPGIRPPNLL